MAALQQPKYRRVLLKISGEALVGDGGWGIDLKMIRYIIAEIRPLLVLGVQLGIVVGGGNYFRGASLFQAGIDRVTGDQMGMFATVLNVLAMRDIFMREGIPAHILSALPVAGILEGFDRQKASQYLQDGSTLLFAGGTGNPLVTTDTALSLRGIELSADLLLKATNVDGIYSADPIQNPQAKFYDHLSYQDVLAKELAVMDLAAFYLCRDHNMRLRVYNMHKPGALLRIVLGENEGTLVENNAHD